MKIGDDIAHTTTDHKGWQVMIRARVVNRVELDIGAMLIVIPFWSRMQHRDHPDRGRDLGVGRNPTELALPEPECELFVTG